MNKKEKIGRVLEFPRELCSNVPKITMIAFDEMMIENFKSVLEYENFFVRIKTHIGNININGFNLKLNQINENDIGISGVIENVDFESNRGL